MECLTELKEVTQELKQDQVDQLYRKHVLSKTGPCGRHHVVDINSHTIDEVTFVKAFRPKGRMVSVIMHAQCSIWNMVRHVEMYLRQECVRDLIAGTTKYLDSQLKTQLEQQSLDPLKQVVFFYVLLF